MKLDLAKEEIDVLLSFNLNKDLRQKILYQTKKNQAEGV